MSRKNEGKTGTCLRRAIAVYARSDEQKKRWQTYAKANGKKLSAFVVEAIESAIAPVTQDVAATKELREETIKLKEEVMELRRDRDAYKKLYTTQEQEIRKYRAAPFTNESFTGVRQYDKELVTVLKDSKAGDGEQQPINNDALLLQLNVGATETEAIQAIYKQLEHLEAYGLAKLTQKGWVWIA